MTYPIIYLSSFLLCMYNRAAGFILFMLFFSFSEGVYDGLNKTNQTLDSPLYSDDEGMPSLMHTPTPTPTPMATHTHAHTYTHTHTAFQYIICVCCLSKSCLLNINFTDHVHAPLPIIAVFNIFKFNLAHQN